MAKKENSGFTKTIKEGATKTPEKVSAAVKTVVKSATEEQKRISEWTKPQKRSFVLFALLMFLVMVLVAVAVFSLR